MKKNVIFGAVCFLCGTLSGIVGSEVNRKIIKKKSETQNNTIETVNKRTEYYYNFLLFWLKAKKEGLDLKEYFKEQQYNRIVLYGAGKLCVRFYEELKDIDNIDILYVVDKGNEKRLEDIEIIKLKEVKDREQPDVVIVTPIYDYKEIAEEIEGEFQCPVVSLEDMIYAE